MFEEIFFYPEILFTRGSNEESFLFPYISILFYLLGGAKDLFMPRNKKFKSI